MVLLREKNYFAIFAKKSHFLLILRKGLEISPPNCLVATATGTGATRFVSVAVNGLRKGEPQLQLLQKHKQNLSVLQLQSRQSTLLKPLTATEAHFALSVPVAVEVRTKSQVNPTKY